MAFHPQPGRIVLTMSADPVLDLDLSDGAVRLLVLLRSLAGHSRVLVTLTQSLATALHRHPDTIRAWRDQLAAAGYLSHHTDPRTGRTSILLCETVEPPSRRALMAAQREEDARPAPLPWQTPRLVILKPDPKPWSAPPWLTPWRELRAHSRVCQGGAGPGRDIKTRKIPFPVPSSPVHAREGEAAWRQAPPAIAAAGGWKALPPMGWEAQCAEAARQMTALGVAVPASWGAP